MRRPKLLDIVALTRDLSDFRLRAGDIGTVVHVHKHDAVEVEFLDREGGTVALLLLKDADVRKPTPEEIETRLRPEPLPPAVEVPIADATRPPAAKRALG